MLHLDVNGQIGIAITWDTAACTASLRHDDADHACTRRAARRPRPSRPEWTIRHVARRLVHGCWPDRGPAVDPQPEHHHAERTSRDEASIRSAGLSDAAMLEHADPADRSSRGAQNISLRRDTRWHQGDGTRRASDTVGTTRGPSPSMPTLPSTASTSTSRLVPVWVRRPVDPGPFSVALDLGSPGALVARGARRCALDVTRGARCGHASATTSDLLLMVWVASPAAIAVEGEPSALARPSPAPSSTGRVRRGESRRPAGS